MLYHKIAQGIARSEKRNLLKAEDSFIAVQHRLLIKPIGEKIVGAGRRLEQGEIRRMIGSFAKEMASMQNVLSVRHTPSRKTVSQTQFKEILETSTVAFVGATADSREDVMLTRERFEVQPKFYRSITSIAPLQFTRHAHQRLLQRGGSRPDAMRHMFEQIDERLGLLMAMLAPGSSMPQRSLAFPIGDGLLLGHIVNSVHNIDCGELIKITEASQNGVETVKGQRPIMLQEPGKSKYLGFVATTFIGPDEMRASQRDLHRALVDISTRHRESIEAIGRYSAFPQDVDGLDVPEMVDFLDQADAVQNEIIDLLVQDRCARAMGNERAPMSRPLSSISLRSQMMDMEHRNEVFSTLFQSHSIFSLEH